MPYGFDFNTNMYRPPSFGAANNLMANISAYSGNNSSIYCGYNPTFMSYQSPGLPFNSSDYKFGVLAGVGSQIIGAVSNGIMHSRETKLQKQRMAYEYAAFQQANQGMQQNQNMQNAMGALVLMKMMDKYMA